MGTAAVGGVGYGIYAASQSNNKDEKEVEEVNPTDEDNNRKEGGNGESEPENGRNDSSEGKNQRDSK